MAAGNNLEKIIKIIIQYAEADPNFKSQYLKDITALKAAIETLGATDKATAEVQKKANQEVTETVKTLIAALESEKGKVLELQALVDSAGKKEIELKERVNKVTRENTESQSQLSKAAKETANTTSAAINTQIEGQAKLTAAERRRIETQNKLREEEELRAARQKAIDEDRSARAAKEAEEYRKNAGQRQKAVQDSLREEELIAKAKEKTATLDRLSLKQLEDIAKLPSKTKEEAASAAFLLTVKKDLIEKEKQANAIYKEANDLIAKGKDQIETLIVARNNLVKLSTRGTDIRGSSELELQILRQVDRLLGSKIGLLTKEITQRLYLDQLDGNQLKISQSQIDSQERLNRAKQAGFEISKAEAEIKARVGGADGEVRSVQRLREELLLLKQQQGDAKLTNPQEIEALNRAIKLVEIEIGLVKKLGIQKTETEESSSRAAERAAQAKKDALDRISQVESSSAKAAKDAALERAKADDDQLRSLERLRLENKALSECWSYCFENGLTEEEQEEYARLVYPELANGDED